ncbi:MAG: MarC family protein [Deltaproteobacteria bacterium]|nr:MarC family protein [Deltaproteobacteria bacterium]
MSNVILIFSKDILLALIPLFVAIDIFGVLPIYLDFVKDIALIEEKKIRKNSLITAFSVGIGFLLVGKSLFAVMGISIYDFEIAGGILLLIISINNLISEKPKMFALSRQADLGVVPIGVPLIVGPGVLTTLLILTGIYGYLVTTISFIINLLIVYAVLRNTRIILKYLGKTGSNAAGKLAALLLAAYAVMMMRVGIINTISIYIKNIAHPLH